MFNIKRTVTIYNTSGSAKTAIQTGAENKGELVEALDENDINYEGMRFILAGANVTLEVDSAKLPETDCIIFLSVEKNKSGNSSYLTLKANIKAKRIKAIEEDDEDLVELIGNYTHHTTEELQDLWNEIQEYLYGSSDEPLESNLETRLFEVEYKLGLVNDENRERFEERLEEDLGETAEILQDELAN